MDKPSPFSSSEAEAPDRPAETRGRRKDRGKGAAKQRRDELKMQAEGSFTGDDYDDVVEQTFPASDPPPPAGPRP